jgi:Ca-activated chloride channel homolog
MPPREGITMRRFGSMFVLSCLLGGCAGANAASTPGQAGPSGAQGAFEAFDSAPDEASSPEAAEPEAVVKAHKAWLGGSLGSTHVLAGAGAQWLGVWVDVPDEVASTHVPMALSLAIDTSGSMSGEKIVHARAAARRLVESLQDGDVLSIVTFSSRAAVVVDDVVLDPITRRRALAVIDELEASGGTALHDGLATAQHRLASRSAEAHPVRRVVVISDGMATVGPASPDTLGALAERGVAHGIQVTSLGVGLDYDETTLNALAVRSSGRLYHLAEPEEMPAIVEEELGLLVATAMTDAELELVPGPGVRFEGMQHARWTAQAGSIRVPLGTMHAGQQRELLVRAHVDARETGERPLVSVRLHFRDPRRSGIPRVKESLVSAIVTDDPHRVAQTEHPRTQTIIAMQESATLALAASQLASGGQLAAADVELERAERSLREQAKKVRSRPARDKLLRQAEVMTKGRGAVKAASRAPASAKAGRATALDLNDAAMGSMGY